MAADAFEDLLQHALSMLRSMADTVAGQRFLELTGDLREVLDKIDRERDSLRRQFEDSQIAREAAERAQEYESSFLHALKQNIPDHIYFKDTKSRFLWVNQAQAEWLGLEDPSQATGKTDFDFFGAQHAPAAFEDEQRLMQGDAEVIAKEEGEDWPNGRVTWVSTTKVPFRDREGRVIGTFGISRDVTAHRAMEVALKQRTEELARSNAELEQFANIISHDLNEPLRTVTGFLQLLAKRYHGQLTHEADEFIDFAVQGGRRMRNLLNDLLMYSRVTTKAQPFEPTEAKSILDQARANLEVAIQQARAEITHDPLPRIMGDETQLIQLFQNLFANAIKFHGAKDPEVRVSARETPEGWEFQVRDNGIGIDPENFERIFQIFQRVSGDETISGTGIGLAVCDKIVKRHGGRIWVESEPDKGSTFHFTLPPAKAEE